MATSRDQIEHLEYWWTKNSDKPWKDWSHSRRWLKKQMHRFLRRRNKKIEEDDIGGKQRMPFSGYEY